MKAPMMNPTTPSLASRNNLASIDYREKLSLKANEIGQLRFLSSNLDDAEEFNVMTTISLLEDASMSLPGRKKMKYTSSSSNSSSDTSSSASSSSSSSSSSKSSDDKTIDSSSSSSSQDSKTSSSSSSNNSDSSNSSSNSSSSSDTVGQQFISTHIQFDIFDKKVNDLVSSLTVDFDIPSLDVNEVTTHNNDKYGDLVCAFSLILGCSFIDLDKILMDIMDLTGIRQDEWDAVRLTTRGPKRNRSIKVLGPLCYHQTRFSQMELERLKTLFFWQGSY